MQATDDRDHRLLGCVGGISFVTGDAPTDREDAVVVAAQQLIETGAVTISGCCDELVVVRQDSDGTTLAKQRLPTGSSMLGQDHR
ncbi:MAG: hypothetical protein ABIR32_12525 [Ilumatobacteraceae bacterium]